MNKLEYRAVIKFLTKEGQTPSQIHSRMVNVYGEESPSLATVKNWAKEFKWGRESLEDDPRTGRPTETTSEEIIEHVECLVLDDGRLKKKEIAQMVGVSPTTVLRILHDHLGMTKVSARWVPRNLSAIQKKARVDCCRKLLSLSASNREEFLSRIVTGDETWVHYYDPESKQESMQWHKKGTPAPIKFRRTPSAGKVMATIFWDSKGILLVDYKDKGTTITGAYYADVLRSVREAIKEKRRGLLSKGVLLLHDNAPVHKSRVAMAALTECGFEELDHPPYSPDLAPSDYFLFPNLKRDLRGQRFPDDESLKAAVDAHFSTKEENYFQLGMGKLFERADKCVRIKGHYIEK